MPSICSFFLFFVMYTCSICFYPASLFIQFFCMKTQKLKFGRICLKIIRCKRTCEIRIGIPVWWRVLYINCKCFLVADTQFYKRLCSSVGLLVGYMATPVVCGWAGAVIELTEAFWQEQWYINIYMVIYIAGCRVAWHVTKKNTAWYHFCISVDQCNESETKGRSILSSLDKHH